jgi:hypothetical protein
VGDEREIELGNAAASIAARYGISGNCAEIGFSMNELESPAVYQRSRNI